MRDLDALLKREAKLRTELDQVRERIVIIASAQQKRLVDIVRARRGGLTARERQILDLIRQDKTDKEIAAVLNIAYRTVKFHVRNLLERYGVESRHKL